jgi:hypothetical protein
MESDELPGPGGGRRDDAWWAGKNLETVVCWGINQQLGPCPGYLVHQQPFAAIVQRQRLAQIARSVQGLGKMHSSLPKDRPPEPLFT